MVERTFPLLWPEGRPRTHPNKVGYSRFDVTAGQAQDHMLYQIHLMGGKQVVISTDQRVKKDGTLYARDMNRSVDDAGVAVYFERNGQRVCFCCDKYYLIWENMRSIGKTIEAMRGIERWGSAEDLDRAFTGFTALPAPGQAHSQQWWIVLGIDRDASVDDIKTAYRRKAKDLHSDVTGGSDQAMSELNVARDQALMERENG